MVATTKIMNGSMKIMNDAIKIMNRAMNYDDPDHQLLWWRP